MEGSFISRQFVAVDKKGSSTFRGRILLKKVSGLAGSIILSSRESPGSTWMVLGMMDLWSNPAWQFFCLMEHHLELARNGPCAGKVLMGLPMA